MREYSHFDASTAGLGDWLESRAKRLRNHGLGILTLESLDLRVRLSELSLLLDPHLAKVKVPRDQLDELGSRLCQSQITLNEVASGRAPVDVSGCVLRRGLRVLVAKVEF